jgi:hypothetical protein
MLVVDRTLDHATGQLVQLDLVAQFKELEIGDQCLRTRRPRCRRHTTQVRAEVAIRVSRFHLPQWLVEPIPDQLEVAGVASDRAVREPGRVPGEDEPGQHVQFEVGELLLRRRCPWLPQRLHHRQRQLDP